MTRSKPRQTTAKVIKAHKKFEKSGPFDWDKSSSEIQRAKFAAKRDAAEERAAAPTAQEYSERTFRGLIKDASGWGLTITINASCGLGGLRADHGALSADYEAMADAYVEKRLTCLSLENRYRRLAAWPDAYASTRERDAMIDDFEEFARPDLQFAVFSRYVYCSLAKSFGWTIEQKRQAVEQRQEAL
jgi:hypothetical protein